MASILNQQSLGNECNDSEPMLQPHPDQTDTIDGEFFSIYPTDTNTANDQNYNSKIEVLFLVLLVAVDFTVCCIIFVKC